MNIMGRLVMRPPILLVRSCIYLFIIFLGSLSFLWEAFYCLLGDPLGEASLGFNFPMAFIFYQLLLPPGSLAPSSHKTRCTRMVLLMARLGEWDEWAGYKMEKWKYEGSGRWFFKPPLVANQNPWTPTCWVTPLIAPAMVRWISVRSKQLSEMKEI